MTNKGLSKIGLRILDRTTDRFPSFGPKIFQRSFVNLFGSHLISEYFLKKYRKEWSAARSVLDRIGNDSKTVPKIAVIVDVCIGDTVLASECFPILRDLLPGVEIHYICNRTGGQLIEGMPGIRVHRIVQGEQGFPTSDDLERLRALVRKEQFQVILNLGPFLDRGVFGAETLQVQLYVPLAAYVLRGWKENGVRHISYLSRQFIHEFLSSGNAAKNTSRNAAKNTSQPARLNANSVYLSEEALARAREFFDARHLTVGTGIVFWNPDATSQFGQIPFEIQTTLLQQIAELKEVSTILLGRAYSKENIERDLLSSVPEHSLKKIHLVPHMPIEAYTALIDASDMFISGDTGPLHIASCRKFSMGGVPLRNRTAVVAIYGATDSKMYGYDSEQPHHAPANQDAVSRSFSAPAPCRNISCINKFGKSCSEVRCFDRLPTGDIVNHITSYFQNLSCERLLSNGQKPIAITLMPEREYAL